MNSQQRKALQGTAGAIATKLCFVLHLRGIQADRIPAFGEDYLRDLEPAFTEEAWPVFETKFRETFQHDDQVLAGEQE